MVSFINRPERGELVARKVSSVSYAFFAASSLELHPGVAWMGLTGSLAGIAEQRHAERVFATRPARLLVEDVESLGLAVKAGLGVALLPRGLAARLNGVVEVAPQRIGVRGGERIPSRDLWMVVHRAKQHVPRVRALMSWLRGDATERVTAMPREGISCAVAGAPSAPRPPASQPSKAEGRQG